MEIKYLNEVLASPVLNTWSNEGFTIEKIIELEAKYNKGNKFPQALREHLFLSGEFNNYGLDTIDGIEELQEMLKDSLRYCGYKIDRPFFAYNVWSEQYSAVLLDEKNEDPTEYLICPFDAKDGSNPLIRNNGFFAVVGMAKPTNS